MDIEMPMVRKCTATGCAYNRDKACHARAITVGGPADHQCDTMFTAPLHAHRKERAGVGACKVIQCIHNEDLECQASSIDVGFANGLADCMTYELK